MHYTQSSSPIAGNLTRDGATLHCIAVVKLAVTMCTGRGEVTDVEADQFAGTSNQLDRRVRPRDRDRADSPRRHRQQLVQLSGQEKSTSISATYSDLPVEMGGITQQFTGGGHCSKWDGMA